MPELPEMVIIAEQMDRTLLGKEIRKVSTFQPKCLNRPQADYRSILPGKQIRKVRPLGKWIEILLSEEIRLLISLGMGGEIIFLKEGKAPPEKKRFLLEFTDGTGFFITMWWFGYIHLVLAGERHAMTADLGPDPLELSFTDFCDLLNGRRGGIKSFLLNQKRIRGIGNFYIQEILYKARLHPLREISSLSEAEETCLFRALQQVLRESIELGSSSYEFDFFGQKGRYGLDNLSFAYQDEALCPQCGSTPQKIRTGTTSQFICPQCQKISH